jgi:hypothetical protein
MFDELTSHFAIFASRATHLDTLFANYATQGREHESFGNFMQQIEF